MKRFFGMFNAKARRLGVMLTLSLCLLMSFASASEPTTITIDTIRTATVTSLTSVQQGLLGIISDILPVALVVMGSILVVTIGKRVFMKFVG